MGRVRAGLRSEGLIALICMVQVVVSFEVIAILVHGKFTFRPHAFGSTIFYRRCLSDRRCMPDRRKRTWLLAEHRGRLTFVTLNVM